MHINYRAKLLPGQQLVRHQKYYEFYLPISSGDGIKQKYTKIPNAKSTAAGTSMANCNGKMKNVQTNMRKSISET